MTSKPLEKTPFKSGYVAIVGRPNVGKSTLLNAILDFKVSSVTRKPQTTRHQIRGILNGDNYQVVFVDTPGLLEPKYKLQEAMLNAAHKAFQDADLTLFLIDSKAGQKNTDLEHIQKVLQLNKNLILVLNKIDLVAKESLLPLIEFYNQKLNITKLIPISALKPDGLNNLKTEIVAALPEGFPFYAKDQIVDHPERFLVAEIIREKIFLRFGDEIPYSTTVEIDDFREQKNRKDFIRATIYVEKKSQKGILIGKKGSSLRDVGRLAREDIESILSRDVFLELWVKVKEKWRQNEISLKDFGYLE